MSLKDVYDFDFLVNDAEKLVLDEMEEQLKKKENSDICTCQDCVLDIAAYALNHVRPAYRASLIGRLYSGAVQGKEYARGIEAAVQAAIDKVRSNPMHGT